MSLVFVFALFSSAGKFELYIFGCYFYPVGVQLSQPAKLCLGASVNWNCNLSGNSIGWITRRADGSAATSQFYFSNVTNQVSLGSSPFKIGPITISGGMTTSEASVNLTSSLNGTTLECSDGTEQNSSLLNVLGNNQSCSVHA